MSYVLKDEVRHKIKDEIKYLNELYNQLLIPKSREEIRLTLKYMKLSIDILDNNINRIVNKSITEEKKL